MIALTDVCFTYPRGAFRPSVPSLDIKGGARVAAVGPSGTGKTTLLNLVAGLGVPDSGMNAFYLAFAHMRWNWGAASS